MPIIDLPGRGHRAGGVCRGLQLAVHLVALGSRSVRERCGAEGAVEFRELAVHWRFESQHAAGL